jgi:hypothetical protein
VKGEKRGRGKGESERQGGERKVDTEGEVRGGRQ